MSLRSSAPFVIAILLAAVLSFVTARVAVEKIEAGARAALSDALTEAGHRDWSRVSVDGLQVVLTGTAPDEAARFAAMSAAGTVVDAARIIDRMTVVPAQEIAAPEFKVEILRNLDGISLIGLIPADYDRAQILEQVGRIANSPVTDLLEEGTYPKPRNWDRAVAYALAALGQLPRSKVSVTADRVAVTGIVDSEQVRRRVETELARTVPAGVRLALHISAPRPVIAPFMVRFVIDNGTRRFDACAAETPEMRDAILAAAREAGLTGPARCQIGLGAPSLDWADAVALGIGALDTLGDGTVTLSDADLSLVIPHTVEADAFDAEVGRLERALPPGFSLTAVRTDPPVVAGAEDDDGAEIPEFTATLDEESGVELLGRLPSERARDTVESYAHAHFGHGATEAATRLDERLPEGWTLRVLTSLDALSYLASGTVRVRPDAFAIEGKTGREDAQAEIARLLSERLGSGAEYTIDVVYEEALDPTSEIPTADECVARLNAVLSAQQISFEPGSATVDSEGLEIIERLAEILRDCQHVTMEIAGHTDSQGRESMNLRLSQERANAVLNALLARRVLTSNLSAKGYGEAVPVADNDTEEGREANRRIEFTLVPEETPEDAEAEVADAEAAEDGAAEDAAGEESNEQN